MIRFDFRLAAMSFIAVGALALSACGKNDTIEAKNESVDSVAEKVAKADLRPTPGRYETRFKIIKMDMPGMPPEMLGMMKQQLGKVETSISCLTKEEAEKSEENFFKPPKTEGDDCKYNHFKMGDGKIEAHMSCQDGDAAQNMQMSGTYGSDAYAMNVKADGNSGPQEMSMEMEIESKRVGDCDGSEKG